MTWTTAQPDWKERIRSGRTLVPTLPLFAGEVKTALAIFNQLRLPDVPGLPKMEEAAGEWQRDVVRTLFGSYDPVAKLRHLREFFLLVPKKSSKTTAGAAIMLTAVLMSRRPRAEFLLVAPTQEVADLAFRQAVGMVEADAVLKAKFHIQDHIKKITYRPTGAFLKVKSFDPKVVTGSKPAGVLMDEVHVIAESHDADRVIGQLRGGLISQPEGFLIQITTQSERVPAGVFRAELMKARAVRDGRLVAPVLPMLYEFPEDVDWRNAENWHMVTPNNGRSITVERLVPDYLAAVESGEEELRRWASQHLNIEIGLALKSDRWAGADHWKRNADPLLTLDTLLKRSEVVTVGLDAGGSDDMTALYLIGREKGTGRWLGWCHCWLKESALDVRKSEASRMRDFQRDGDLTITQDLKTQFAEAAAIVARVRDASLLPEKEGIGVDRARIDAFLNELNAAGIPDDWVLGVPQNWLLMGPILACDRKLAEDNFPHVDQPVMDWAVSNAKVEVMKNAFYITKQASGTAKIDPVMAMLDAAWLMARNPEATAGRSFWEKAA